MNRRVFLDQIAGLAAFQAFAKAAETQARLATDTHHHIYDSRFPPDPKATLRPADATVRQYRLLQQKLGTTRSVVVQPSTYGVDNRCLLDALATFGKQARGIAVVNTNVSDAGLKQLDEGGVRGIRFNLVQAGSTTPEMIEPLAKRIAILGWHIQINASADQIAAAGSLWDRIPVPVVFDHFGHVTTIDHPAFRTICRLMQADKGWTKLSGMEGNSRTGAPTYADCKAIAEAFVTEAPERLLWGSNWPHPTSKDKVDDVLLLRLFKEWVPDKTVQTRILADNPAKLFGFS